VEVIFEVRAGKTYMYTDKKYRNIFPTLNNFNQTLIFST